MKYFSIADKLLHIFPEDFQHLPLLREQTVREYYNIIRNMEDSLNKLGETISIKVCTVPEGKLRGIYDALLYNADGEWSSRKIKTNSPLG
ncbi:MAG: hypothetical protein GXZ19_10025 [Bacteroidales bacterium]|nr:hypothetical protein [Bacteroidales bacterium]